MDNGGASVSRDEMKRALRQAFVLNEYLLRQAWGLLYIVLALSMFLSSFGSPIIESFGIVNLLGALVMDMTASGCGLIVILWTFKRIGYTAEITHSEDVPAWSRLLGYRLLVPLWTAINVILISTVVLASPRLSLVFFLLRLGVAAYLYYALRLSFSKKIPGEAIIAIGSLSLSSVASIALLSIVTSPEPYELLAGAMIVAWVLSGIFARTRPIPESDEEHDGLE